MPKNYTNCHNQPTGYEHWSTEALQARKRELEAWLLKEFPMPATETDEDAHIERVLQQHLKERTTAATPPDAPAVGGNELLQEVSQFIARYLQCSEHQRTLLALWVLHTYCFCAARVTPYLAIRSAEKQSGKTLCLQLLSLLCDRAALTSGGFTARDLAVPMKEKPISSLLFDECHLTLGTRTRPRSPALRAVLAGSFHLGLGHRNIAEERNAFLPKAFASQAALPEELADRCIPIILEPLRDAKESKASSDAPISRCPDAPIERFDLHHVADQIKPLRDRLERWTKNHFSLLTRRTLLPRSAFPPNLSPRQQDLCDPLLQIAALVGGPWIARALQACAIVFDLQSIFELRPNLQLLADVRDCFAHHNWPDRLPTEALLDWTDSLPPRAWDADGPLNARKIAHLLRPFHIHPRELRMEDNKFRRGYELKDFQEPWKKYFPQSKIPNKDKGCDTIALAGGSPQTARRRSAVADDTISAADLSRRAVEGCRSEPRATGSARADDTIAHNSAGAKTSVQTPVEKEVTVSPARKGDLPNLVKLEAGSQQPKVPASRARGGESAVAGDTKNSAASTDQPTSPPAPWKVPATPQQPRPDEILPGITCGDVFDDRWLRAFRR